MQWELFSVWLVQYDEQSRKTKHGTEVPCFLAFLVSDRHQKWLQAGKD